MDSKELAGLIENEVNVMGSGQKWRDTAENLSYMHRTLQQSFVSSFLLPMVRKFAENKRDGWFDARNEVALGMCKVMWDALVEKYPYMKDNGISLPMI